MLWSSEEPSRLQSGVSACAHQAMHNDSPLLAQAVAPVLSLPVDLGIEVHIMQDDCIGPRQVQALPASPRAEQEGKDVLGGIVEPGTEHRHLSRIIFIGLCMSLCVPGMPECLCKAKQQRQCDGSTCCNKNLAFRGTAAEGRSTQSSGVCTHLSTSASLSATAVEPSRRR